MNIQKEATINLPLSGLRWLYSDKKAGTLVCEVPVDALKRVNQPQTIEEIIAEAEIDYATGDYKSFDNPQNLMEYLNS